MATQVVEASTVCIMLGNQEDAAVLLDGTELLVHRRAVDSHIVVSRADVRTFPIVCYKMGKCYVGAVNVVDRVSSRKEPVWPIACPRTTLAQSSALPFPFLRRR